VTEPLLLGVRDAARRLGIGRDSAYAAIRERRLRAIRVGRRVLVPVAELERFVETELERAQEVGG
jgi:excisionase family DNA binding protein